MNLKGNRDPRLKRNSPNYPLTAVNALTKIDPCPVNRTRWLSLNTEKKHVYQSLFEGDLTQRLEVGEGTYAGVVSSGTFTHGHVGPDAFEEVLRCMTSGAWAVLSVNATHWDALGFEDVLKCLAPQIAEWRKDEFALYGAGSKGAHAADTGWLLQMRKA